MGRKHRDPWGGPPIDDLALKKHRNRDGSKFTIEQLAGLVTTYLYLPSAAWRQPSWRFVACSSTSSMPQYPAGMNGTLAGETQPGVLRGGSNEQV
jgi:hypothetical protein